MINKVSEWNTNKNLGIVFGATNPEELKNEVSALSSLYTLLPGIGAQGGSLKEVVASFEECNNKNFIINVSRAIIYADSSENFAGIARLKLLEYNEHIKDLIKNK